jgi:hypothetical protein
MSGKPISGANGEAAPGGDDRPDTAGITAPANRRLKKARPKVFSVGLMECTLAADLPLRKGVVCPIPYIYGAII